jgi:glycosyltransferase involved in cell wall biosynthesis
LRIFILGLPHVPTTDPTVPDTAKINPFAELIWNLCKLFVGRGHEVIHLGTPGSCPPAAKLITVDDENLFTRLYAERDPNDPRRDEAPPALRAAYTAHRVEAACAAIHEHGGPDHSSFVLSVWDSGAENQIAQRVAATQYFVEPSIGYLNTWAPYRAYNSYAWMHYDMGRKLREWEAERWYWTVIPQLFDLSLFGPIVPTADKSDYCMVQARMNRDKGIATAINTAKAIGLPLKLCGRGDPAPWKAMWPEGVEVLGEITVQQKCDLLRHARCLLAPTYYMEPLGNIVPEALASGCPVLTTDWGGFIDTVEHGRTGFRCRSHDEFCWAAEHAHLIEPANCRVWAEANCGWDVIGVAYEAFFRAIADQHAPAGAWTRHLDRADIPRAYSAGVPDEQLHRTRTTSRPRDRMLGEPSGTRASNPRGGGVDETTPVDVAGGDHFGGGARPRSSWRMAVLPPHDG